VCTQFQNAGNCLAQRA